MTIENLRPTEKQLVSQVVRAVGIPTDGWKGNDDPSKRSNWCFGEAGTANVAFIWHNNLRHDGDHVYFVNEAAERADICRREGQHQRAKRADDLDRLIGQSYFKKKPIRVAIVAGSADMDHDKAKYRVLDEESWFPHHRDPETGKIIVIRGVPQSDDFDPSSNFLGAGSPSAGDRTTTEEQSLKESAILESLQTQADSSIPTTIDETPQTHELDEEIGAHLPDAVAPIYPDEVQDQLAHGTFAEGATRQVLVNQYERNPRARSACIRHWGRTCYVCGFDFQKTYGEMGRGFVHVHHLTDIASIGEEYEVDPRERSSTSVPELPCHASHAAPGYRHRRTEVDAGCAAR